MRIHEALEFLFYERSVVLYMKYVQVLLIHGLVDEFGDEVLYH